jgi:hypothetical protein
MLEETDGYRKRAVPLLRIEGSAAPRDGKL